MLVGVPEGEGKDDNDALGEDEGLGERKFVPVRGVEVYIVDDADAELVAEA